MTTKSSVTSADLGTRRGRGRPRSFDIDETTEAALLLFWRKGFESTTLEEIIEQTGINGSSLFAAYGNKHGLFMAALQRYRSEVGSRLELLEHGEWGLEDLVAFIHWLSDINSSGGRPLGCLMVNSMVEFGTTEPSVIEQIDLYRQELTDAIRAALIRASKMGEISEATVDARTQLVHASLIGALAIANVGSSAEVVGALNSVSLEVERWRKTVAL
jgi:AcrR family transcriptional regulator